MPLNRPIKRTDRKVLNVFKRFPRDVARESVEFFKDAIEAEAWEGKAWPNRKREPRSGPRAQRGQRGLLIVSGRLRDSIRATRITGREVIVEAGYTVGKRNKWNLAQIHNEGLKPVPKRQFIGDSKRLRKMIKTNLNRRIKNALQ